MTVFIVETYVVKPQKQEELVSLLKRIAEYKKENPEKFKEMRSKKIFSQMFGGISGQFIEMIEFDSLAEAEKYVAREEEDEEFMKLYQEARSRAHIGLD